MSTAVDETYEVYVETERKARTTYECGACHDHITAGDLFWYVFLIFDGETESLRRCQRCQAIHLHLRTLAPGDMWPDERLDCGEEYEEHWGDAPPEDIAALAFASREEMQRLAARAVVGAP